MAQPEAHPPSRAGLLIDLVLVAVFFGLMFMILRSHVPSSTPAMVTFWSAAAAACLSGVFWLAVQMFRVVARYQRALRNR